VDVEKSEKSRVETLQDEKHIIYNCLVSEALNAFLNFLQVSFLMFRSCMYTQHICGEQRR